MAKDKSIHPIDIEQARVILRDVASLAATIRSTLVQVIEDGSDDYDENKVVMARELLGQIGYLADLASNKIGGTQMMGGAESWLLPPVYHWGEDKRQAPGGGQ